jgi:hypothetical protein
MSRVTFLAATKDPVTATTIYGRDHQMDFADESQVAAWNAQGKVALMGAAIRNPRVTAVGTITATIAWTVDQPCTAMQVNYGTSTSYGSTQNATPASGSGDIVANLTALTTATLYHYRIAVTVGGAVTYTADATFTTS